MHVRIPQELEQSVAGAVHGLLSEPAFGVAWQHHHDLGSVGLAETLGHRFGDGP